MEYASRAQSRGQHLFCSCAVVIRLLLLLPSTFILISIEIAESKKTRVYNSIASLVKFSVIKVGFMCQRESKIPLHDKNFITAPKSAAA